MALTNADRVAKMLDTITRALEPYVEREYSARYGERWTEELVLALRDARIDAGGRPAWDAQALLSAMMNRWNEVFRPALGRAGQSYVGELREFRNMWAHQQAITSADAERALDTAARLLTAISAPEALEVERQRQDLRRLVYEEQTRREVRKAAVAPLEGQPAGGLRPWREVVTPHPDVASGRYQQAEFAADLWQVHVDEGAPDEYRDPSEFFRRTYLTEGLRTLLVNATRRLADDAGDPVVELQTNFGGGKTHSMLALYHLFSGLDASGLPGLEPVLAETGDPKLGLVRRAVLVGTKLSPGQPERKPGGTIVRTLWGELAYQLGGQAGFELVREADETSTNPGDSLRAVLAMAAPCVVFVDEWVAYARQLHDAPDLPGGSFETHFSFAQALTEAVAATPRALLVVSIPASDGRASDVEVGGERGRAALARLKNVVSRVAAPWRPATGDESFEIVRRRLFQPLVDPAHFVARDAVVKGFMDLYRSQGSDFPSGTREADYERKLKAAYPVHPELFERLYTDWSTLEKFQRTRGVLRLMAAVIHQLWERDDRSLLILPASVPIDASPVLSELTRYMDDPWVPVIEKDVDGPDSLPIRLDRENPNLGRLSAARRVARTLYMGSAPTLHLENRGLEESRIRLGCVQPGESPAVFGDALRRLTDAATHLYVNGQRYWYATQPSVTRLAQDRAESLSIEAVHDEVRRRLASAAQARGDFARVHVAPASSSDVPNEPDVSLVVLGPEHAHAFRSDESPARREAETILRSRGTRDRTYRNALVFLAPDRARLSDLESAVRTHLAWKSIVTDAGQGVLNLDSFQATQATTKAREADGTVGARVPEAYAWLLMPGQPDPQGPVEWQEARLQGQDPLAVRASRRLRQDQGLATAFAGTLLRMELDRVPLWRGGDHVSLGQLAQDFAAYLYLPRLRDAGVLRAAAREGVASLHWEAETFAYADAFNPETGRYLGLRAGPTAAVPLDATGLLVRPEVAARQLREDEEARRSTVEPPEGTGQPPVTGREPGPQPAVVVPPAGSRLKRRFHGSLSLDAKRFLRDAAPLDTEVIQRLANAAGVRLTVTVEIQAEFPDGASDDLVRTISENARTLRFANAGFEEE